jgi:hypothetical protein
MNRPGYRTAAFDVPAAGNSHNVTALIKDFTERQKERAGWSHRDARAITPREVIGLLGAIVERPAPVMANRVAGFALTDVPVWNPPADCRILSGSAAFSSGRHRTAAPACPR